MYFFSSSEESHVGSSYLLVGVPNGGEKPLSNASLGSVGRKEIVEQRSIQWSNRLISKIIIVRLDLWALVVVRLINHGLNKSAVFIAESLHCIVLVSESWQLSSN
jgi:hypothetical protein